MKEIKKTLSQEVADVISGDGGLNESEEVSDEVKKKIKKKLIRKKKKEVDESADIPTDITGTY